MRVTVAILCLAVLGACAYQRAHTASEAKSQMVGMSAERVLTCMGAPTNRAQVGETEVWAYQSGGDSKTIASAYGTGVTNDSALVTGSSGTMHRYCVVNVIMSKGVVSQVNYSGRTGGLLTEGEQCAFAVENCVP